VSVRLHRQGAGDWRIADIGIHLCEDPIVPRWTFHSIDRGCQQWLSRHQLGRPAVFARRRDAVRALEAAGSIEPWPRYEDTPPLVRVSRGVYRVGAVTIRKNNTSGLGDYQRIHHRWRVELGDQRSYARSLPFARMRAGELLNPSSGFR